jgi:hypothetical protein
VRGSNTDAHADGGQLGKTANNVVEKRRWYALRGYDTLVTDLTQGTLPRTDDQPECEAIVRSSKRLRIPVLSLAISANIHIECIMSYSAKGA